MSFCRARGFFILIFFILVLILVFLVIFLVLAFLASFFIDFLAFFFVEGHFIVLEDASPFVFAGLPWFLETRVVIQDGARFINFN